MKSIELSSAPPLLIGAGLMTWGWQNNYILYALLMTILLETVHLVAWRWPISDKEFNNVADLSSIIFFIVVVYIFATQRSKGIFIILSILPFIFFLIVLTQLYSEQGKVRLSTLFVSMRRLEQDKSNDSNFRVDISLPYFIICIISASAGNQRTIWFFIIICLLFGWLFWTFRPGRYDLKIWIGMLVLSVTIAYFGQIGIRQLQAAIEASVLDIFDQFMWRYRDPNRATTAIGSIGRLKVSDRIVLRVRAVNKPDQPLLLREATYNTYGFGIWSNQNADFNVIDQNIYNKSWTLNNSKPDKDIEISTYMTRDTGVIPLPHGATTIKDIAAIEIQQNNKGAVNMEIREGWITYTAEYQDKIINDIPPANDDLYVPENYRDDFDRLVQQLHLKTKKPEQIINIVEQYFSENFFYSLQQQQRYPRGKYLASFLFETKSGHCEFFATATVLLLRRAGIPARYAVGYSVQEYSPLEGQYIARSRHAHSWTLAYVGGNWRILDTTPSIWAPYEEENASPMESLIDVWSWLSYRFSRWQTGDELKKDTGNDYIAWLLIPLIAFLAWRLYFKERINTYRNDRENRKIIREYPGKDSSIYQLIAIMENAGFSRRPGETLAGWFARISDKPGNRERLVALDIHYRYRFDPDGISADLKHKMNDLVRLLIQTEALENMNGHKH